jgi:hypothetical protein
MYTSALMIHTAFLLLLAAFSAAPQESVAQIQGVVVRADTGDVLSNATVVLSKDGAGRLDTKYGTTTRADGHFTVKDLPKGRYRLLVTMRGFVDQEYGQKRPNGSGAVLDLTNETVLRDITVRMIPGGVISGHVSDQMGHPLEGVAIRAFRRIYTPYGKPLLSVVALTVTNDIGDYRMYWLSPGSYYLIAVLAPLPPTANGAEIINQSDDPADVFASSFYPSGDDDSQAKAVSVEPGAQLRGMDFLLTRMKGVKVGGRISGGESGEHSTDVSVVMRAKFIDPYSERLAFAQAGHIDNQGNFEIPNVAAGKYTLSSQLTLPGFRSLSFEEDVQVGNQEIANLQFALRPSPKIDGRLITEGAEPLPQDRTVLLFNNYKNAWGPESFGTGVLPDGTFTLSNVTPSVLLLELSGFPELLHPLRKD